MNTRKFLVKKSKCPNCRVEWNGATDLETPKAVPPSSGDFTICVNCGQINIFDENLSLKKATEEELKELTSEQVEIFANYQREILKY